MFLVESMSGRRMILAMVVAILVLVGNVNCEDSTNDSSNNGLVPTYTSGAEKILLGIEGVLPEHKDGDGNILERSFGKILNLFESNFHAIFPGTLWCGAGDIANSEQDVGLFNETDNCCRAHDSCPNIIDSGGNNGVLLNNGIFTRSACSCDHEFYRCLKNVNSVVSDNLGRTYFTILRPQCFAYDYPIESCAERGTYLIVEEKCLKYNLDESRNKTYEWFDNLDF